MKPYHEGERVTIYHGRCEDVLPALADASVSLVATDPPYFRVKDEPWDRAWKSADSFISWLGEVADEWRRLLKPNGSLYCFAGPKLSGRVETMLGQRFNVLNRIRWVKPNGDAGRRSSADALRQYRSMWEEAIFAEHYGADGMALGESSYAAQCQRLRGFVFEPLRSYVRHELLERAGMTRKEINAAVNSLVRGGGMASHYVGNPYQWKLPTAKHYQQLRVAANAKANGSGPVLRREYEDLRREYEDLRREYEDLRRPFSANGLAGDVWCFPTVKPYPGKHPCEKPLAMMEHVISTSSRPGDTVLDSFAGSGSTVLAAARLGRHAIAIESDERWCEKMANRLSQEPLPLEVGA